jgi:hypothetical protein
MNQIIWGAMREYVQAEVRLAVAELRYMDLPDTNKEPELEPLRLNVTRFETEVRRLIDALPRSTPQLDADQLRAINNLVPYGVFTSGGPK